MAEVSLLPASWQVPQNFRDRLGHKVGRQRAMIADGHVLLVLHAPPKADEHERRARLFWRSPDGDWSSTSHGKGVAALRLHLADYADLLDKLDRQEDKATTAEAIFAILRQLAPLHRAVHNLHRVLQEARKLIPQDHDLIDLRDAAYDVERNADLLYTGLKNAMDYDVARRAEEQAAASERMAAAAHRLNIMAAFFFPLATLSAIFGTNLTHGLELLHPPYLFFTFLGIGVLLGGLLLAYVMRTKA